MKKEYNGMYITAIVACVAVVALVVLVLNNGGTSYSMDISDEDLAGQAIFGQKTPIANPAFALTCNGITDGYTCNTTTGCYWGGYCSDNVGDCGNNLDQVACEGDQSCTWETGGWGDRCESNCPNINGQWICISTPGCSWEASCYSYCEDIGSQKACLTRGCTWNGLSCSE